MLYDNRGYTGLFSIYLYPKTSEIWKYLEYYCKVVEKLLESAKRDSITSSGREKMTALIKQIIGNEQSNHVLSDKQLARMLGGSDERCYGQVNRAIKAGELIRVKRGIYVLADKLRDILEKSGHPIN